MKLSRIARFCRAKGRHAPNFTEKTFVYSHKTVKFAKVFSLKKFSTIWYLFSCTQYTINLEDCEISKMQKHKDGTKVDSPNILIDEFRLQH